MQHPFRHSFPSRLPRAVHKFLSEWMSTRTPPCCRSGTPDPRLPILLCLPFHCWVLWVLALDPVPGAAGAVGRAKALRYRGRTASPSVSLIEVLYCFHQNIDDVVQKLHLTAILNQAHNSN